MDVERRAEETANVPEQESSALFCVTVKAGASTTMECKLCDATNTGIAYKALDCPDVNQHHDI